MGDGLVEDLGHMTLAQQDSVRSNENDMNLDSLGKGVQDIDLGGRGFNNLK